MNRLSVSTLHDDCRHYGDMLTCVETCIGGIFVTTKSFLYAGDIYFFVIARGKIEQALRVYNKRYGGICVEQLV